jgi:hypothetical protein
MASFIINLNFLRYFYVQNFDSFHTVFENLIFRRLSSVLKHKKPPKRGGRKPGKSDPPAAVPSSSTAPPTGSPFEVYGPLGDSFIAFGSGGSSSVDATPPTSRSKWGSGSKSSFLSGLHPSRWGRASSTGPERPSPPVVCNVVNAELRIGECMKINLL